MKLGESELKPGIRQPVAPLNLTLSRTRSRTPRYCTHCGGPWGKELRGGPVVHHTLRCSVVD
jgi:hypothetical protein